MLRLLAVLVAFSLLGYAFWASPTFSGIAAGVALFLFGMMALEQGFRGLTGGILERLLHVSTNRLWKSLSFGAVATAVTQSSSLVSVLTISFLSAGLLGLGQGIGVIFGANLGTTTGAWLMAGPGMRFDIGAWALPFLTFGIVLILSRGNRLRAVGWVLTGIGFLFLGIQWMKEGFEAFRHVVDLSEYAVPGVRGLLLYTAVGMVATVIMQSSHATLLITITALTAGQIDYENALAISIGANIGTTISALIAAFAANVEGRRLAGAHLVFNLTTALVALVLIHPFMLAVDWLAWLAGIADDAHALRLAIFHTLFNAVGIILMLPFIPRLVGLLEHVLKGKPPRISKPRYISPNMISLPGAALEAVRLELIRLFHRAFDLMARVLQYEPAQLRRADTPDAVRQSPESVREVEVDSIYTDRIKPLHGIIIDFLAGVPVRGKRATQAAQLRAACQDLVEAVKHTKHLHKNLVRYLGSTSQPVREEYQAIRANLGWLLSRLHALSTRDDGEAIALEIDELGERLRDNDIVRNGKLDQLIRDRRITSEQATSLMNDSAYAYRLGKNLLKMARILLRPLGEQDAEHEEEGSLEAATED